MVNDTPILTAFHGPAGHLVLNRPQRRNALNLAMWQAIPDAVSTLLSGPETRAIVVRGCNTEAFASGADIEEFATLRRDTVSAAAYDRSHAAALAALRDCPVPVIAQIDGFCIGGGVAIAMACDLRVAGPTASFALPPAKLGLAYPLDSLRDILCAISPDVAKELFFTARRIDVAEALAIGLVGQRADDTTIAVTQLVAQIAANAPLTQRHAKAAVDLLSARSLARSASDVEALAAACFDSADYREGQQAFAEKRLPQFTGR